MQLAPTLKAVVFDVFGTCVDWRSGIAGYVQWFRSSGGAAA